MNVTPCHIKHREFQQRREKLIASHISQCNALTHRATVFNRKALHTLNLHWASFRVEIFCFRIKAKIQSFCIKTRMLCLAYNRTKRALLFTPLWYFWLLEVPPWTVLVLCIIFIYFLPAYLTLKSLTLLAQTTHLLNYICHPNIKGHDCSFWLHRIGQNPSFVLPSLCSQCLWELLTLLEQLSLNEEFKVMRNVLSPG